MENNNLNNLVWSEEDFDYLSWHDCKIHAIAFDESKFELHFDIDFILEWIRSDTSEYYSFRLVPCILTFKNVYDLNTYIGLLDIQIQEIRRKNPGRPKNYHYIKKEFEYDWIIETTAGDMSFKSIGFIQYAKGPSAILKNSYMTLTERGGVLFMNTR